MATNVDQLHERLAHYRKTMEKGNGQLSNQFEELQGAWCTLHEHYEGVGAEEFGHAWAVTATWFESYFTEMAKMNRFLEERYTHLKQL